MEAPRYTAKEIEDGLYSGMDPDVELVAAQYYDAIAAEVDARDEVITRMLAILEPGPEPNCMDPKYNPSKRVSIYDVVRMWHEHRSSIHARAVAIAEGRTE